MRINRHFLLIAMLYGGFVNSYSNSRLDSIVAANQDSICFSMLDELEVIAQPSDVIVGADKVSFRPEMMISGGKGNMYDAIKSLPGIDVITNGEITQYGIRNLTVYMDGRKSILSGENLVNYLKSITVTDFSNIEIIESAGAKGEGGDHSAILNLVRKRKKNDSYSVGFNLDGQIGKARQVYGAAFARYCKNLHDLSLTYSRYMAKNPSELSTDRPFPDSSELLMQAYDRHRKDGSHFLAGSYVYNASEDLGMGASLNFNHFKRNEKATMTTKVPFEPTSKETGNHAVFITDNLYGEVYAKRKSSDLKSNWIAACDFFKSSTSESQFMKDNTGKAVDGVMDGNTGGIVGCFDYNRTLTANWQISAGGRVSYVAMKSSGCYDDYSTDVQAYDSKGPSTDGYGSDFSYTENVNAMYAEARGTIGRLKVSGGVRGEQSNFNSHFSGNESSGSRDISRRFFHLYPSFSLMYGTSCEGSWMLAYANKTTRPNFSDLDPFIHLFDDITHVGGNINLKEADKHSMTLGWSDNRQLRVTLAGEYEKNGIVKYYRLLTDRIVYVTPENIPTHFQMLFGVAVNSLRIRSWWNISAFTNLVYSSYRFQKDTSLKQNSLFTPMAEIKNQFKLPFGISAEANASFRGKMAYGQAQVSSVWNTYVILRKAFYNRRLTLSLYMKDIIDSNHPTSSILLSGRKAILREKEYEDMRKIGVSVSWNMDGGTTKSKKEERKMWIDELDRVNM